MKRPVKKGDVKAVLARIIASEIRQRRLTQSEAARIIGDAPSQVSLVVCGHLRGFSVERLVRMLTRLSHNVTIVVVPTGDRRRSGTVHVLRG